ncbi:MAG: three-Cys-motif partner protein TcmP [Gallionella sp.]
MEISESYRGREHAFVKHELLKNYLEKLLFIMGMSGVKEVAYVDCFAGPYQDESENIQATSIAISLNILKKVQDSLRERGRCVEIRAIYVEEKKSSYKRLNKYLEERPEDGIKAWSIHGDYSEHIDQILRLCGERSFVFFFIDPLGWVDVGIPKMARLLSRPNSEFLINFMYDFLNRFVGKPELREQVSQLLGELTDGDFQRIQTDPKDRERFIVGKYREQIKKAMGEGKARTYSATIKDKDKNRTKYHLVYGTRHPKGIVEFAKTSEGAEFLQRLVRSQSKHDSDPNASLFSSEEEVEVLDEARVDIGEVKKYWLSKLGNELTIFDEEKLANMLEETGWLICDLQNAFQSLAQERKVENLDAKRARSKNPVNFENGERLRKIK